jgi:excisionase family DNA binding protein
MNEADVLDDAPTKLWARPTSPRRLPPPPPRRRAKSTIADTNEGDVLTADEVAGILRVDRKTVYDAAGRGEMPHRRLGKRMVFSRAALLDWLACKGPSER